jgi:hypothetical protein
LCSKVRTARVQRKRFYCPAGLNNSDIAASQDTYFYLLPLFSTILLTLLLYLVIAEVLIFVLPVPVVLRLKLRRSKKIQLLTFFGLGMW